MSTMHVEDDDMKVVAMEDLAPEPPVLRVADRCDHGLCGAQAFVVSEHDGKHLFWCGHHAHALKEHIEQFIVLDNRDTINRKGGSA